jgi:glycosyltransferase involved in cell wall biosynthesis
MRIVHIEDFFLPTSGYQVNVLAKYQAKHGHEVHILTSSIAKTPKHLTSFFGSDNVEHDDREYERRFGVTIRRFDIFRAYSGRAIFKPAFFSEVRKLEPEILFVHGNDSYAGLIYTLRSSKVPFPIVFDNHMLEMATQNRFNRYYRSFYRKLFAKLIAKKQLKVIRVVDDPFVINQLAIPEELAPILPLGTDTMNFHPDNEEKARFRKELGIDEGAFVFVYAGKLDESKGGHFLARTLHKRLLTPVERRVVFLIVGNIGGSYGQEFETQIKLSENQILRFPTQNYLDLPKFYQAADAAIYPKQCSLSFYDAQACGLPVVIENNPINLERIKNRNGMIFQAGDVDDFREKLSSMCSLNSHEFAQYRQASLDYIASSDLNYEKITRDYESLLVQERDKFLAGRNR